MKIRTALVILSFTMFFGCHSGESSLPEELIGVWKTSAPKYRHSYIEFMSRIVIFGNTEKNHTLIYHINKVEKVNEEESILYTITSNSKEEEEYMFSFHHHPGNDAVIRLKNQNQIEWKKSDTQTTE